MRIIVAQVITTVVLAGLTLPLFGTHFAYSMLVGGVIGVVPNYYLAGRLIRQRIGASAEQLLRAIYVGEFLKIAFTAALFVIAIRLLTVEFLVVVAGYLAVVIVNWLALRQVDLGELPTQQVGLNANAE